MNDEKIKKKYKQKIELFYKYNKSYYDKNECPNDPGGYFIVSGQEKVIISQDEGIPNMPVVYNKNKMKRIKFSQQI